MWGEADATRGICDLASVRGRDGTGNLGVGGSVVMHDGRGDGPCHLCGDALGGDAEVLALSTRMSVMPELGNTISRARS